MQKRCAEDRVCGVLRFQAGLACRISREGSAAQGSMPGGERRGSGH